MNAAAGLEDGYRRLLAMYPAGHRRVHEEEMLGVLMTGARTGQCRPGLAESADLVWGALRIRLRPARDGSARVGWRDALTVVSVILPLLFLVYFAATAWRLFPGLPPASVRPVAESVGKGSGVRIILAALVLLRLRRTAALAAAATLIWYVTNFAGLPNWTYFGPQVAITTLVLGLEIVALLASPGPRRGVQILTWRHYALAVGAAAAVGSVSVLVPATLLPVSKGFAIAVIAITAAGMTLASDLSKRILALLSVPLYYFLIQWVVPPSTVGSSFDEVSGWDGPLRITLTVLPLVALACAAAIGAAVHFGRRALPAHGQDA